MRKIEVKKSPLAAIKLGLGVSFFLCLFFLSGIFDYPELGPIDMRYRLKPQENPSAPIVFIGITQRCINQLGNFPWPHTYHADLIDFLKKSKARVIVMDIFFTQPDADPAADERLSESLKNAGNVILPVFMPYRIPAPAPSADNFISVDSLVESRKEFSDNALSQGHINLLADSDGVYRKVPIAVRYSDKTFFSLGLEAALKYMDIRPDEINLSNDCMQLRDKKIQLENSKFAYINFSSLETASPRFAFSDVIKGLVGPENFKDKLVFVGHAGQGAGGADIIRTPLKEKYGITVQADIANTLLGRFFPKKEPKYKTCAWIIILSLVTCLIMINLNVWYAAVLVAAEALVFYFAAINSFIVNAVIVDIVPLALAIIFSFAAAIIYRIRFADQMAQRKEVDLDTILAAGITTAGSLKTDKAYDVIMGTIINSVGARGLLLRWKEKNSKDYKKCYIYGIAQSVLDGPAAAAEQKLAENAIKLRKAFLIGDIKSDPLFGQAQTKQIHSILCAPLILNSEAVGVLTLFDKFTAGSPNDIHFNENDLKLFMILTQQTAISLENVRLLEEVNELFLNSIESLAGTIDAKDSYTHGHSKRVTTVALAIAGEMGLDSAERNEVMVGAILHDIGKIGIKDEVLLKPGYLTPEEKNIFNKHPEMGSKIMKPIGKFSKILPIIRHHHERYDGAGYPDKLKYNQIPLGARIIAVADTFDAMTSDRPYRKALSEEAALEEINRLSGEQFDPKAVEAFNRAYKKGSIKKEQ